MEILILICLLIVIALLLQDKVTIKNQPASIKSNTDLPDIMGQPKPAKSQLMPIMANESQPSATELNPDDFDLDIDEDEETVIPLNEVSTSVANLLEEEDLTEYGFTDMNEGFATGVSFEELQIVGKILQQEIPETSQQQKAIETMQKIYGTELFSLLESSIDGAAEKIAALLDKNLLITNNKISSSSIQTDLEDFDIETFV